MGEAAVARDGRTSREPAAAGAPHRGHTEPPKAPPRPAIADLSPALDDLPVGGAILRAPGAETPKRDSLRRRALALADMVALLAAYGLLWIVAPPPNDVWADLVLLPALPLWVVLNKTLGLYDRDANVIHKSTLNEFPKLVHSISLGTALAFLFAPLLHGVAIHRPQMLWFWALTLILTPAFRTGARSLTRRVTAPERVLIIGSGQVATMVSRKLAAHPEYGSALLGYVDSEQDGPVLDTPVPRLGDVTDFERVVREYDVERVVIAFSALNHESLLDLIRVAKRLSLKISVVPRLFEVIGTSVEIDQIEGMTLLGIRGLQRTKSTLALKRAMDIGVAGLGLIALAPLLAVCALLIKLTSPGPVLFGQRRVGRGHREFRMYKLRTMVEGADALKKDLAHLNDMDGGVMFKAADDPRVTPVGRVLRTLSIDELPQLWNVLRGEMSLVGPRPLVPAENDQVLGWHRARLDLTPGLTGPWQVMGRNTIPFHEMVKIDYLYVAEWSLWNDVKLLVRTLPAVLGRTGA